MEARNQSLPKSLLSLSLETEINLGMTPMMKYTLNALADKLLCNVSRGLNCLVPSHLRGLFWWLFRRLWTLNDGINPNRYYCCYYTPILLGTPCTFSRDR